MPVDSATYAQGSSVVVLGNIGGLVKGGYSFVGWQTGSDGSGTMYTGDQTFSMGAANVTLYALWSGGNAYVANYTAHTVSQYTIGPNGALTPMSPATVPAGNGPWSVTVDAGHRYAYVANFSGTDISQYTIDPSSGALTPMSPATVAAGTPAAYANSVAVDPSGRYAYAVTQTDGNISQYTIGSDGALTLKASTAVLPRSYPDSIAIDPSGRYVYVSNLRADPTPGDPNYNQYTIAQFTIDPASGTLTQMNPGTVRAESGPRSVVVDPRGGRVYAVCFDHGQVSEYAIGPGGALTPLSPATVAAGRGRDLHRGRPLGPVHLRGQLGGGGDRGHLAVRDRPRRGAHTVVAPDGCGGVRIELGHGRSLGPVRLRHEQHRQHGVAVHYRPIGDAYADVLANGARARRPDRDHHDTEIARPVAGRC